jgi:hypothetical protein
LGGVCIGIYEGGGAVGTAVAEGLCGYHQR